MQNYNVELCDMPTIYFVAFAILCVFLAVLLRAKPTTCADDSAYLASHAQALVSFDRMHDSNDTTMRRHEIRAARLCVDLRPVNLIAPRSDISTQHLAPDYLRAVQRVTPFQF